MPRLLRVVACQASACFFRGVSWRVLMLRVIIFRAVSCSENACQRVHAMSRPPWISSCFGFHFWFCIALFGVRRGLKMIVSHRAPSSLNMSSYRAIWTHFRPIFMIFIDLILQTGKSCWHLGQAHDRFTTDSRQIHHRFTRDAS